MWASLLRAEWSAASLDQLRSRHLPRTRRSSFSRTPGTPHTHTHTHTLSFHFTSYNVMMYSVCNVHTSVLLLQATDIIISDLDSKFKVLPSEFSIEERWITHTDELTHLTHSHTHTHSVQPTCWVVEDLVLYIRPCTEVGQWPSRCSQIRLQKSTTQHQTTYSD